MTKPIIIDGVNVAECKSFQHGNCNNDDTLSIECVKNKDCYFKKLKRLEKENEELRKYQYEQEYLDKVIETLQDNLKVKEDEARHYLEEVSKYRQALKEIKNFSENFCSNNCPYYTDKESNVCNDGCLLDDIVNPIIKKIVEVLNEK